jgi:biopolymer transport protein ExbD
MFHRRRNREPGPEVTLPITPMLDMSFQLLFFFMATFNPTDPEGAQILAMAMEKKVEEKKPTDQIAKDPKKVDPNVDPSLDKRNEKKKEEELEQDNDLRLEIDPSGGKEPIALTEGERPITSANLLTDADLRKALEAKMTARVRQAEEKARETLRKQGKDDRTREFKNLYEDEFANQLSQQKVRVRPTKDVAWGEVFDAMNMCTSAWKDVFEKSKLCEAKEFNDYCNRVGFKGVALTTPKGYEPKNAPGK